MGAKAKQCGVLFGQAMIIEIVYGITFWKYYNTLGQPSWMDSIGWGSLVIAGSIIAGILGVLGIAAWCSCCCFDTYTEWRPSVIVYLIICAFPCSVLLLHSHLEKTPKAEFPGSSPKDKTNHDDVAQLLVVFQAIVAGLVGTEWIAKFRMECLTYNLVEDAATDFFFAYDVFDFYDRFFEKDATRDNSLWLIVTVVFALFAMIKYCPCRPLDMENSASCCQAIRCIVFGMVFNDIPFVAIRVTSICLYGFQVVDFIHPLKNAFLIIFGIIQIKLLKDNENCRGGICRNERYGLLYPL